MATLTQGQIQAVAIAGGLSDPSLMAAIAMAESSGDTNVINSIGCVGLWQINQPVHVKDHPNWTVAYLQNPLNNALAAKTILNSQGLNAWTAYSNGSYLKFYKGQAAQTENAPQGIGDSITGGIEGSVDLGTKIFGSTADSLGIGGVTSGINSIANSFLTVVKDTLLAGEWLSKASNWVRISYVIGGAALVVIGLYTMAGQETLSLGKKVADSPIGKTAVKLAK